ncbi:MAG: hypothetical protein LPK85_02945 [Gammaproteobacteria bacterium]|nr:hypothetical protein [Gammaproteobacteria bacterium]
MRLYSEFVDSWDEDAGDSNLMLGARQVIAERWAELSEADRQIVTNADEKAVSLLSASVMQTYDVEMLRLTVELIMRSGRRAA